ncbi:5-formyltetrahydrofolate cyclo-ligase [Sporosarcina siberiensis]|uniref:5-formyltetrahydrofolate cyclo-ligase n=1 Tax=Sporosarcina siberiensis TaxID=1365606 RepID=A0ABW4SAU4_9BACL
MNKKIMRNDMLAVLNKMEKTEHEQLSCKITERIITSKEFKNAETIGITISRFPEVDTRAIIEAAWALNKKIAVPKCLPETRDMDFRNILSFNNLEIVYDRLLEPIINKTESVPKESIDLQIVPGVVYTTRGYRIGFGGGYYDRYIKNFKGISISLAFECQITSGVPAENHDIPVAQIFTEKRQIICTKVDNL